MTDLTTEPGPSGSDQAAGPPTARIFVPERVAQPGQGPEAPEELVLAVDDDVVFVDALDGQAVAVLPQVARADDLVPQVDGSGLVPAEQDAVLARLVQGVEEVQPAAGRVDKKDVRPADVSGPRQVVGLADRRDRQELQREFRLPGQGRELAPDPGGLVPGVGLGLDAAPGPPARLGPALRRVVDQDRFDLEGRRSKRSPAASAGPPSSGQDRPAGATLPSAVRPAPLRKSRRVRRRRLTGPACSPHGTTADGRGLASKVMHGVPPRALINTTGRGGK